jgi:hypothetical protein
MGFLSVHLRGQREGVARSLKNALWNSAEGSGDSALEGGSNGSWTLTVEDCKLGF